MKANPVPDKAALRQEVAQFLASEPTLSLATVDDCGQAHAANLWYAQDARGRLYFVSHPAAAHCRHVARDPRVAATIYFATGRAGQIRGVQLRGRCQLVDDPAQERRARRLFALKFPKVLLSPATVRRLKTERF